MIFKSKYPNTPAPTGVRLTEYVFKDTKSHGKIAYIYGATRQHIKYEEIIPMINRVAKV